MRARALYDFIADSELEISIKEGEIIEITESSDDDWFVGRNAYGETGRFPKNYVEIVSEPIDEKQMKEILDEFGDTKLSQDTDSFGINSSKTGISVSSKNSKSEYSVSDDSYLSGSNAFASKEKVPEDQKVYIVVENGSYFWKKINSSYTVTVESTEEKSKFSGLKTFVVYKLVPTFTEKAVLRRYKHFDWLHKRLKQKYYNFLIPPIPKKKVLGNFEVSLVEQRRIMLQKFVDYMCIHPVLSESSVWKNFLTIEDEKLWKDGKRKAEKDKFQQENFLFTIEAPQKELLTTEVLCHIDESKKYMQELINSIKLLESAIERFSTKSFSEEYDKMAIAFESLSKSFQIDDVRVKSQINVSNALKMTAGMFENFKKIFDERIKGIMFDFTSSIDMYVEMLTEYPQIFQEYQKAQKKRQENLRHKSERKISHEELMVLNRRTDVMFYAIIAELNNFRSIRDNQLNKIFQTFLENKLEFYSSVAGSIKDTRKYYD